MIIGGPLRPGWDGGLVVAVATLLLGWGQAARADGGGEEILDVGDRRQLFIDGWLIDRLEGARLEQGRPHAARTVIHFDRPWEGPGTNYVSVFRDGKVVRMYSRGYHRRGDQWVAYTNYAVSTDGLHWEKPSLGLVEFDGSSDNNIVFEEYEPEDLGTNMAVFLDHRPGVPEGERIKMVGSANHDHDLVAFNSRDGKRFVRRPGTGVLYSSDLPMAHDSMTSVFWSESEQRYLSYFRHKIGGKRSVARTESRDLVHWSEPVLMKYEDTGSEVPANHFYVVQTLPYFRAPQIYLAPAARLMQDRAALSEGEVRDLEIEGGYTDDLDYRHHIADVVLLSTRGGDTYQRTFDNALIRPGPDPRHWLNRGNFPARGLVQISPTEMALYVVRDFYLPSNHLEAMVFRLDGFASVAAGAAGGMVTTKPFSFRGDSLEINYSTAAAGELRVGFATAEGNWIEGLSLDDCEPMVGDAIARNVKWRGGADLGALAGRPVVMQISLREADLFSFIFASSASR